MTTNGKKHTFGPRAVEQPKVAETPQQWVETRTVPAKPKRLSIDLDPTKHGDFKSVCAKRGISMVEAIEAFIDEQIANQ